MAFNPRYSRVETPGEVRRVRKSTHFTITPIGGKEELARWKIAQEEKEARWQVAQAPLRAERRERAVNSLCGLAEPSKLTSDERAEIAYVESRRAAARKQPVETPQTLHADQMRRISAPIPEARKSLLTRFKEGWANLWNNAFGA